MTDNPVVHLIDDDEDVRRALAFLLGTAGLAVRVYEFGRRLSGKFRRRAARLHRQRCPHAGHGRHSAAAALERKRRRPCRSSS